MGVQSPQDFEAVRADQAQFGTPWATVALNEFLDGG
jgi:hypothetical protein